MMIPAEYDEIRPYTATEVPQICNELIADPEFQAIIKYVFKDIPFEYIAAQMCNAKDNLEFQKAVIYPFMKTVLQKLSSGLTVSIENKESMGNSLCISNHRDIIMDSAILDLVFVEAIDNTERL